MKTYSESSTKDPESLLGSAYSHIDGTEQDSLSDAPSIEELLRRNADLWLGCDIAGQGMHGRTTGYPQLDDILPGRGWPQNGLLEIINPQWGMGELQLLIPLMRSVIKQGQWILWISPPHLLYAPALVQAGIDTGQILVVNLDTSCKDALWSMEKALQTKNCGLVLAWQTWLPGKVLRRLQLAAESGNTLGILFKHRDSKYSPSRMRLQIKGPTSNIGSFKEAEVTVIKARGNFQPLTIRLQLYQHHARI
ncbi:MAG: translesion DNA synthesis-associated protein ImuA [Pseudomonadota bacterium]|jgi:cell division inhibitor SulA|nr:translesion DNA synthesis-associated protein ImuA [Pseudomonadota bacterium]|tara:strand:- start:4617 stop:5366 length:750 start_codon:yes stop_codon:yes gene_type:complete